MRTKRVLFLAVAVAVALVPQTSFAVATALQRHVQIVEVDFAESTVTLKNLHATSSVSLAGWQFCSHDDNESFRYSSPIGAITLAAGATLRIHYLNDSGGAPGTINRTAIGGSWALPLDSGAFAIGLYINGGFGSGSELADHIQWSIGGVDDNTADGRSSVAQAGGLWTNQGVWISTQADSAKIQLTTPNGATVLHGPADYTVVAPNLSIMVGGLVKSGANVTADVVAGVNVDVYRSLDLQDFGVFPVRMNVVPGVAVQIDDAAPAGSAYYQLVPAGSPAP